MPLPTQIIRRGAQPWTTREGLAIEDRYVAVCDVFPAAQRQLEDCGPERRADLTGSVS